MSEPMDADVEAVDQQALADQWAAALEDQAEDAPEVAAPSPTYQPAALPALESSPQSASSEMNLDVILDIPVTLSIELGRTRVPIRNLMQLNQGSVVELDRIAGEPLDVLVNGTLIAHGEAVVVNEKFGIRLTDVVSPSERVRRLR